MTRNLGSTTLRRKRRSADPMRSYDALPAPLRHWLAQATLPWSPTSVRRIWRRACAKGLSPEEAITVLSQVEARTLAHDRFANTNHLPTKV
ncbi:DUF6525 family protein [Parasulfitobacter algicola]|uniref:Integrase n=1 Tax=Parasulfitobacter algicola TaxID=2614809 RepID=A0ABX2IRW7_9RHOB|nr:DUF6525 family protein [Sulfitobacter algicola]NSX55636.1 hypothetical protein [Sulfitobacter algicola]